MSRIRVIVGVAVLGVVMAPTAAFAKGPPSPKPPKQTTISLSASTLHIYEGGAAGNVVVNRGGNKSCGTTVSYTVTNGTAEAGDYSVAPASPLTWAANESTSSKNIVVTPLADVDTGDETLTVAITAAPSSNSCTVKVVVQNPTQSVVTIHDDVDGDGAPANTDNCPAVANADQADADADSVGDACDAFPNDPNETTDTDADTVGDNSDNCPNDANAGQEDNDLDGDGDVCDTDDDNDGVLDGPDNCQYVANAGQEDVDGLGAGEACDGYTEVSGSSTGTEDGNDGSFEGDITNSLGTPDGDYSGLFTTSAGPTTSECSGDGFFIDGTVTLTYGGNSFDVDLDGSASYFCVDVPGTDGPSSSYNAHWEGSVTGGTGDWTGATGSMSYDGTTTAQDSNKIRTDAGTWLGAISY